MHAENLILKRKYSTLTIEHEEIKQKQARLKNTIENLHCLVSQLLTVSSSSLKIANQGRETTSDTKGSNAGGEKNK